MDDATAAFAEASGTIGSRFESQKTVDEARERKEREWKEAYARLGQEPPPKQDEPIDDGRTLYERLQINKEAKREEWDNKMKLSNQYRGLETEELQFLAERAKERKEEEKRRQDAENAEVRSYREQLAAKNAAEMSGPPPEPNSSSSSSSKIPEKKPLKPIPGKAPKKDVKSLMKGVVVKKKPKAAVKPSNAAPPEEAHAPSALGNSQTAETGVKRPAEDVAKEEESKKARKDGE